MEPIIGFGSIPQDKWSMYGNTNTFLYDGMTVDEYVTQQLSIRPDEKKGELMKEFWSKRDEAVANTATALNQMQENPDVRNLKDNEYNALLQNTYTQNADSVLQVEKTITQWEKLDRIINEKGGTVLGYDIETFGDTSGRSGVFGITEFGIGKTEFESNGSFRQSGKSFAIGLDKTEQEYVTDLLNKFKSDGLDSLKKDERVVLSRMSMYAGESGTNFRSVFSQITEEGQFKGMWEVKGLSSQSFNPEQIERGIKNLSQLYEAGATRETVIPVALNYLYEKHQPNTSSKGAVITGANTKFDIGTLLRYAKNHDEINSDNIFKEINIIGNHTVDLVYGTRAAAAVRNISVSKYQEIMHGRPGGGASVQSLLNSLNLSEIETHLSISDINQQIRIFAAQRFSENGTLSSDIVAHIGQKNGRKILQTHGQNTQLEKRYNAKNSLFLLNRGWPDKNNGTDIALIKTREEDDKPVYEATQNYTISGEYWELDGEHTGYIESEDKYVLSLKSTADDTIVSKQFDTVEEMGTFLRSNADWFERNDIINRSGVHKDINIENQIKAKYQDRGRREFERAIDPSSVSVENGRISGGFASMEEFLNWNSQYGGQYSATPEGFSKFVADQKNAKTFNINKANNMQAYLGMQEKISDESQMLSDIVAKINKQYGPTTVENNMTKTIALRKAYIASMEEMKAKGGIRRVKSNQNLIANDIYGIDVNVGESIKRINTQNVDAATRDINRIFSEMTKKEAVDVINDFGKRNILTEDQVKQFTRAIYSTGIEAGGDKKKAQAISQLLKDESIYQVYSDIGYALHESTKVNETLSGAKKKRNEKDTPQFTLESISDNLETYTHTQFRTPKGNKTVNDLYQDAKIKKAIDSAVNDSISKTPIVTYYDQNYTAMRTQLQDLAQKLNYGKDMY